MTHLPEMEGTSFSDRLWQNQSARIRELPHRTTLPAFATLVGERNRRTGTAEYVAPDATSRWWLVVDPSLRTVARVRAPTEVTVLHVDGEWLVAHATDEVGREMVRVYGVRR